MLYQRSPLKGEHEYFLDCAVECDEINSFCHAVLTLLGDREIIGQIMDYDLQLARPLRARHAACFQLDDYAHQIVAELSQEDQRAFAAVGMRHEPFRLNGIAEFLARFNHEDQTTGGAALDFRRYQRCDENYDPTPRARRKLYSPKAIRRYVKLEDQSVPAARRLAAGLKRLPVAEPKDAGLVGELLREQRESHRQEYIANQAKFQELQKQRWASLLPGARFHRHEQRRAIRRAASFASGLIGADQVSAFARGKTITLKGEAFNLEITRRASLATIGHSALDVDLCAPDGLRLASVCVYFERTPAIDQVAALAMHMQSGEEQTIIDTGNLYGITSAGAEHPLVQKRLARPAPAEVQAAIDRLNRHGLSSTDHERKREAQRRYLNDTIGEYLRCVITHVWGRDAHRLVKFSEAFIAQNTRATVAEAA